MAANLYGAQTIYHSKSLCYKSPPERGHLSRSGHIGGTYKPDYTISLEPDNSFRLKISPSRTLSPVPVTDQAAKVATNGLAATFEDLVIVGPVTPADNYCKSNSAFFFTQLNGC